MQQKGYSNPHWVTYNQAKKIGKTVTKGQKGTQILFASSFEKEQENGEVDRIPFMKVYTVFNVEQLEDIPEKYKPKVIKGLNPEQRFEPAEQFFGKIPAKVKFGGNKAYYSPEKDSVAMPNFEQFHNPEAYYSTYAHELTHWTKHESRLNREFGRKSWGDEGYAREELVAELSACFVAAHLGIRPEPNKNNSAYIQSWLKVLKNDKTAIAEAAKHAQKATNYLIEKAA